MNHSTTVTPETEVELLNKFAINSAPMVNKLVHSIFDKEYEVYLFTQDGVHFVSEILNIDWDQGAIWLGTPYDKSLTKRCNISTHYTLVAFPNGIKVQFAGVGLVSTQFQGADAIRLNTPKTIVRLQLRNFFRVIADEELNRQVSLSIPTLNKPESLLDLSLAGCGVLLRKHPDLQIGQVFRDTRLTIPDGDSSIVLELEVRNLYPQHDTPELIQVGFQMKPLRRTDEHRLQRFLLATERRQRAARHSVD